MCSLLYLTSIRSWGALENSLFRLEVDNKILLRDDISIPRDSLANIDKKMEKEHIYQKCVEPSNGL